MKVLMIFIDGFGLGNKNESNPYYFAYTPFLDEMMGGHLMYDHSGIIVRDRAILIPTDATMGIKGSPQSATGQTALWTGINAAQVIGYHVRAYPTRRLREIIKEYSVMKVLTDAGKKVTSANAYRNNYLDLNPGKKVWYSASTLTIISAGLPLRNIDDLNADNAVYQDFTNRILIELGYNVKIITPREAGVNLAKIAAQYDFTLYEYFQTDRVGHKKDMARAIKIYEDLDTFISSCAQQSDFEELMLIVSSDHGNIEDLSTSSHTCNKVPTLIIHNRAGKLNYSGIKSITDITPFLLNLILMGEENSEA